MRAGWLFVGVFFNDNDAKRKKEKETKNGKKTFDSKVSSSILPSEVVILAAAARSE